MRFVCVICVDTDRCKCITPVLLVLAICAHGFVCCSEPAVLRVLINDLCLTATY